VSPGHHRVGVAVDLPRSVVVATTVARHVTKNVRMSRCHAGQRHAQRRGRVDGQSRLELRTSALTMMNTPDKMRLAETSRDRWPRRPEA